MKKKTNEQTTPVMDERQKEIAGKALNLAGGFLALCMVIAVACDLIIKGETGWEFFALIGACFVFLIANKVMGNIEAPKSWCGKTLPVGDQPEEKATRRNSYLMNALLIGGTFTVMEGILLLLGKDDLAELDMVQTLIPNGDYGLLVAITVSLTFVIFFGISFLVNFLYHEKYELKAYRKMLADLDED